MKKAFVLVLAVLYVTLTSGVMVNIHYCMGEFAGVEYGHAEEQACGKCGMEDNAGCCHTEHKLIKSDKAHILPATLKETGFSFSTLAFLPQERYSFTFGEATTDLRIPGSHAPPHTTNVPLRLLYCVYRI